MIAILHGELLEATPISAIISAGGVGYFVNIPVTTAEKLPGTGQKVALYTHVVYREDDQSLYGFATRDERDFFRLLVEKVSGIGPKIALALMSKLSLSTLRGAIASGDVALLSKTPGIGKKTAERLVVELRDKVMPAGTGEGAAVSAGPAATASGPADPIRDAVTALMTLGYSVSEADKAVRKAADKLGKDASTEALIKRALAG